MTVATFHEWLASSGLSLEEAQERADVFSEVPEFDGPQLRVINADFYNITSPLELAPVELVDAEEDPAPEDPTVPEPSTE